MKASHRAATTAPHELRRMLWRMLPDRGLTLTMVAGMGGDRELASDERQRLAVLLARRGEAIYSDLLFTLTHQWFAPEEAKLLWQGLLRHKYEISAILGRNVRVTVAAVDYLYNVLGHANQPSIVAEDSIWEMAETAVRDSLTHLYDLPTLCMHLEIAIKQQERYRIPVSIIIVDVDDFKAFNDTWGHQEGDKALGRIGGVIASSARDVDVCSRWGGEEFAVMVAQSGPDEALMTAERIRRGIERAFPARPVTVSVGVSSCPQDAGSVTQIIENADRAMYHSKASGKNRVTRFSDMGGDGKAAPESAARPVRDGARRRSGAARYGSSRMR